MVKYFAGSREYWLKSAITSETWQLSDKEPVAYKVKCGNPQKAYPTSDVGYAFLDDVSDGTGTVSSGRTRRQIPAYMHYDDDILISIRGNMFHLEKFENGIMVQHKIIDYASIKVENRK